MTNLEKYEEKLERAELRLKYYTTTDLCYRYDMPIQTLREHDAEMAAAAKYVTDLEAVVAECRAVNFRCGVGRHGRFIHTYPDIYPRVRVDDGPRHISGRDWVRINKAKHPRSIFIRPGGGKKT